MKKILMIGMSQNSGGIETCIMNIYRKINRNKFSIDFLNISDKPIAYEKEILESGGKIHNIRSRRQNYIGNHLDLIKFYRNNKYDIIHYHVMNNCYPYPILYASKGTKILVHSHTSSTPNNLRIKMFHSLYRFITVKFASNLLACSNQAGKFMFGKAPYEIINNGIDSKKYMFSMEKRLQARLELDLKDSFVLGHIGAFLDVKNHGFLIDIFQRFEKSNSNSKLVLIGEGNLKDDIKKKVEEYGLTDKVLFLGKRSDIDYLLCALDVLLLPSKFEGVPFVVVESQMNGLKTLISNNISKEVVFTSNVKFLPIEKDGIGLWITELSNVKSNSIRKESQSEYSSKYDVNRVVSILENEIYN